MKRNRATEHLIRKKTQRDKARRTTLMANRTPDKKAQAAFKHSAYTEYKAGDLIRAQGQQMESCDVLGYLDKRGQDKKEKIE